MANYLKGIGDMSSRTNEIPPSLDARINKFLMGHTAGVINSEFNEFSAAVIDRGVAVKNGLMQAQGYFGCCDTETVINFVLPAGTNYVQIYAEIDLSVVPNKFEVKAGAMSNSASFTFRQDNLRTMVTGVYQMPLWQVTLTAAGITLQDKRTVITKPTDALHADEADHALQADNATNAVNATSASSAARVTDRAGTSTTAAEFYVGTKLIRIET